MDTGSSTRDQRPPDGSRGRRASENGTGGLRAGLLATALLVAAGIVIAGFGGLNGPESGGARAGSAEAIAAETTAKGAAPQQEAVSSYLEGRITVSSEIDTSTDYSGFRVVVGAETGSGLDTLGSAVTGQDGRFSMRIDAPSRGIYSVVIGRYDQTLTMGDIAIAEGDSARLEMTFPRQGQWLSIRSDENASWIAYKNLRVQHSRALNRLLDDTTGVPIDSIGYQIHQSADMLWGLRSTFPGTIGGQFGAAESVTMLEGWNDSLALARAEEIEPENPRYVDVGRATRRATARRRGQAAALDLLGRYAGQAPTEEEEAAFLAERVRAHLDSLEQEEAIRAAQELRSAFPESRWAQWADRAEYEANNLLPGMDPPALRARTVDGASVDLDSLRGRTVVLEFWAPQSSAYRRQLPQINSLYEQLAGRNLTWLSVSLESDPELDEAFRAGRSLPGLQVRADSLQAERMAQRFNVMSLPTRFVIGPDGRIQGKYAGQSLAALRADLLRRLQPASSDGS